MKRITVLLLIVFVLSGCTKVMKDIEYIKLESNQAHFRNVSGDLIKFSATSNDVKLLEAGQSYSVKYALRNWMYSDYTVLKIRLNQDASK